MEMKYNIDTSLFTGYGGKINRDIQLYLEIGKYDIDVLIGMNRNFLHLLREKGYNYRFYEFHEGLRWGYWKAHLGLILKQFVPYINH